jgi:hypothetical protein
MTDFDETAIREAFHETRLCKDGGPCHSIAHDDEDEDGYRARFMAAFREARQAATGHPQVPPPEKR